MDDLNTATTPQVLPVAADERTNLENIIKNYIVRIETIKKKIKEVRGAVEDSFASDAIYQEHDEKVKEATRIRNATKAQLCKSQTMNELIEKVNSMKGDLKEMESMLKDYLSQFYEMTKSKQIEDNDGVLRDIVVDFKLVKRSQLSDE